MYICINQRGDVLVEFLEITEEEVSNMILDYPLTHALVVAKNQDGFLLILNHWKKNWELAGGLKEEDETLRECAIRELSEESNQQSEEINFIGLMKFRLHTGKIEYGGLFSARINETRPFIENEEADKIIFWNGKDDIGRIDEIDQYLLRYYKE